MDIKKVYIITKKEIFWARVGIDLDWMPRILSPDNLSWLIKNPEYEVGEAKDLTRNRLIAAAKNGQLFSIDPNDQAKGGDIGQ